MESTTRARLHDVTLAARALLTAETTELLEGVYGLHQDGRFEPAESLPALQALPEVRETRARLERLLADERAAGLSAREAAEKLVKETAFTWLNRIAAFKMLEARRLLRQSVARGHESNGFKLWLTQPGHEDDYARYEAGALPRDAFGEDPRDTAYRHYLLDLCREMAAQIRVLFDPDALPSRLFPRPRALAELLALINRDEVAPAWAEDETIGWIYQYFNEPDLDVFRSQSAPKVPPELVAAKIELFTPRWIVEYLVQNTLGRLWVQMHPDSRLREHLDYLVPEVDAPAEPLRPVREITLLDPACGTMHFGLVAFDLFAAMYREELERAGEPDWPRSPSVRDASEIPAAILEHNLFGIDIDLRAVQLSALTLLLKARTLNPDAAIRHTNLACADVRLLNGTRLDAFLQAMRFSRPIYERIIRAVWKRLHDANQLGSLLRLEEEIRGLVLAERERYRREGEGRLPFPEMRAAFEEEADEDAYWASMDAQIQNAFGEFARAQARDGVNQSYFVGEATKGMQLLDVVMRRYDIVTTNPPYLDSRDYNTGLKKAIEDLYSAGKRNLYAAFQIRCLEFLRPGGRLGIITPQTFMFISSYEQVRAIIRAQVTIESLVHTGLNTFPDAVVDCALYVLRREPDAARRDDALGTYFRLVREPDAEAKRQGFERAVAQLRANSPRPVGEGPGVRSVYRYRQGDFDAIPGAPWVYWITSGLRRLFVMLPRLEEIAKPAHGLSTCNNFRYLRNWWELGTGRIGFGYSGIDEAKLSHDQWFPYMKGGEYRRWWGNQAFAVNWSRDGAEIKEDIVSKFPYLRGNWGMVVTNPNLYFKRGVTWSKVTSGRLSTRLSPGGFIFDVAGTTAVPPTEDTNLLLGVTNSSVVAGLLTYISPTVNYESGQMASLPIPASASASAPTDDLVNRAIAIARSDSAEDETTYEFASPPAWPNGAEAVAARHADLARVEREIDEEVYQLYGISAEDRAAIEAELAAPVVVADGESNGDDADDSSAAEDEETPASALPAGTGPAARSALATRWVSYAVGIALGRFQPGVAGALGSGIADPTVYADLAMPAPETITRVGEALRQLAVPDAVAPLDSGRPDNLAARVVRALELLVGEGQVEALLAAATGGRPLADWLARDFFKSHVQQYRKRPIYWLLQSPKRRYGVYVFHERVTRDTLHLLRGSRYLGGKLNATRAQIAEQRQALTTLPAGAERRRLEREVEAAETLLADLEAFDQALAAITTATNSRGAVVGWVPELDDGVLINLAPLHTIMPAWSAEPKKCWEAVARGDYDWSHTAMRYWPERVLAKCRENRSYAIAHGVETVV